MADAGARKCERCGHARPGVKYDGPLKMWLCNVCWFHTPPPGERPASNAPDPNRPGPTR